jgi:hypothetical protein
VPTFVVGTGGDERADRAIRAQVDLIRALVFPTAPVVTDASIAAERGPGAWPPRPILYGGPHVNTLLERLAPGLPLAMSVGRLAIGEQVFEGDQYRLIAVIPARAASAGAGPAYPEFLLYAGTADPGVAEINAIHHGAEPILVADEFGRLRTGTWEDAASPRVRAVFTGGPAPRIAWRRVGENVNPDGAGGEDLARCFFAGDTPPAGNERALAAACQHGVERARRKLELAERPRIPITFYIHDTRARKRALTGDGGDGHAVVASRVVHLVRGDAGALEHLAAHEGTHVLCYEAWGPAGTPLLGEGVAVWASGSYGGAALDEWQRRRAGEKPAVAPLLGRTFRAEPENRVYPLAGLFVEACVRTVGLDRLRDCLYGATAPTWDAQCARAGSSAQELEKALGHLLE